MRHYVEFPTQYNFIALIGTAQWPFGYKFKGTYMESARYGCVAWGLLRREKSRMSFVRLPQAWMPIGRNNAILWIAHIASIG